MKINFLDSKKTVDIETKKEIEAVIKRHAKNAANFLELDAVYFKVEFSDKVAKESGVNGFCPDESQIKITIDEGRKDLEQIINNRLPETVYHEMNHIARRRSVGFGETFLDVLFTEGIAIVFQKKHWKHFLAPWASYSNSEIEKIKVEIEKENVINEKNFEYREWFLGGKENIPKWSGYKYGTFLVNTVIKQTSFNVEKVTKMSTNELTKLLHEFKKDKEKMLDL